MSLTEREKEQLKALIDAGQKLPPHYRSILFEQPHEAELIWPGKTREITNIVLPFQTIEHIDEPRTGAEATNPTSSPSIREPVARAAVGRTN